MALTPYARALWKPVGVPFIAELLEDQLFDGHPVFSDNDFTGRRMQVVWTIDGPVGLAEIQCITTHDFVNITDDETDNTWTDEDFEVVEDGFSQLLADLTTYLTDNAICQEGRWYKFGPTIQPTPEDPQAPVRVHTFNDPGGSTAQPLPPQLCASVTEKIPVRRRWGRFYLPGLVAGTCLAGAGQFGTSFVEDLADAVELWYDTCYAGEIIPVVWSPTVARAYAVTEIQVDNLPDVIRSRRPDAPTLRETRP